jgi:hypothetical protein
MNMPAMRRLMESGKSLLKKFGPARRPTIIVSAGMPRSGSTWLFNAARLMLLAAVPPGELASGWIGDWSRLARRRWRLVKVHDYLPWLARRASVILYSYRDLRDALASAKRKFGIEPSIELARQWVDADQRWRQKSGFTLRYENMIADPVSSLGDLARVLKLPAQDNAALAARLEETLRQTVRPTEYDHDPETLLHKDHVTDGRHGSWERWLSPGLRQEIEGEFYDWFHANQYANATALREYVL